MMQNLDVVDVFLLVHHRMTPATLAARCAPATSNGSLVDTTVQPKAITFPTDAKLLHAAIKGLNRLADKCGLQLRQSYLRIAKRAAMMAGRYAHAKQFQRHHRQLRLLRTRLWPPHPRHPPQDRRAGRSRDRIGMAAGARRANPFPAAAPARVEALFLPRARGRMHRQGQSQRAL